MMRLMQWLRYRSARRTFWGSCLDQLGGKAAEPGLLRRTKTVCWLMKHAEIKGWYD